MSASWKDKFSALTAKTHSQQATWWLNGFWEAGAQKDAELIYTWVQKFKELEFGGKVIEVKGKGKEKFDEYKKEYKEGSDLDEFNSHRFLESVGETLTVIELRKRLEGLDLDKNRRLALSEYLLSRFKKTPQQLVDASGEGQNKQEIEKAEKATAEASAAVEEVQRKLEEQKAALEEQKKQETSARQLLDEQKTAEAAAQKALDDQRTAEAAAKQALAEAKSAEQAARDAAAAQKAAQEAAEKAVVDQKAAEGVASKALADQKAAEAVVQKAEDELRAAVEDLKKQEEESKSKKDALRAKTTDGSLSTVQKSKAVNELAQLESEDPLPLRKAKITQEAALKKVEKERKAAQAVTAIAQEKVNAATAATAAAKSKAEAAAEATKAA